MQPRNSTQALALEHILKERQRQLDKWGEQAHHDTFWAVIEGEEFGEVCRAVFETDADQLYSEVIQVAAVALAWAEDILHRNGQ